MNLFKGVQGVKVCDRDKKLTMSHCIIVVTHTRFKTKPVKSSDKSTFPVRVNTVLAKQVQEF